MGAYPVHFTGKPVFNSHEGPPKKVYTTTKDGRKALKEGMDMVVDLFRGVGMTVGKEWPELNLYS